MPKPPVLCLLLLVALFGSLPPTVRGQDCAPPKITAEAKTHNIFSPEQEMVLGELTYQRLAGELRFVRSPELIAYVNGIGDKLIRHLPPTGLKIQFFIIDLPEANAFDVPGGYIFISRKLIGFANSEDELAGVLGHELGHAVVRHGASRFSELLKKILDVTEVGNRKDIVEKYNLLIERRRTRSISRRVEESEQQLQADRIGLFAMAAAGYDPNAFPSFFDRFAETEGKTGNWFSDIFGTPKPEQRRLREMIKLTDQLPAQCRENHQAGASQEFLKWQADVVSYRDSNRKEELSALLWKKELSPKLRSDITHLAFRPDGQYFLAQDDSAITVVQREPLQVAFQIPTSDADQATFTPDGQFVVFGTETLRYEKWSIAEKRPVEIRELVVRRNCLEHGFSPNGKYLACVGRAPTVGVVNLDVLDTQTGKKIWEKKEFSRLTAFELLFWVVARSFEEDAERTRLFHIEFSPDSHLLAVSRSSKFHFSFENTLLALDLSTLEPVNTSGELKKATRRPFLFLDSNRILAMSPRKLEDGGIFSFPEGKRLAKFPFGAEKLALTANPNYVILKPLANAKLGIFDVSKGAVVAGYNKEDATLWNDFIVYEATSGKVTLSQVRYDEKEKRLQRSDLASIEIPARSLGRLYAADVSNNLKWLAFSSRTRGAIWSLDSGERKMHVRGFRGAVLANDGNGISDFPKQAPVNHSLVVVNPMNNSAQALQEIPERGARQYGRFLLIRRSLKEEPQQTENEKPNEDQGDDESSRDLPLTREVRFELRDLIKNKTVWSREFPKEAPGFFLDQFSGRLILQWTLGSDAGKARLKEDSALAARAKELESKDNDYLMEVVDCFAGKSVGTVLLETGKGSFYIKSGFSEGDWLVLNDSNNRVLVYAMKDGDLRHRFFGANAVINPARNQIVIENFPGELTFYDLNTGDSQAALSLASPAAFVRFSLDGKKLFALSRDQIAYAFDVDKLVSTSGRTQ